MTSGRGGRCLSVAAATAGAAALLTAPSAAAAPGDPDWCRWREAAIQLAKALDQEPSQRAKALREELAREGITAGARVEGCSSAGKNDRGGTAGARRPAQLLDLQHWKLTLPRGAEGDPTELLYPELQSFAEEPYFQLTPDRDGIVFRAPIDGATTKNSKYPRTELREMAGEDEAAWSNASGAHTLQVRQAITEVPPVKPHVVAVQIHDGGDDVLQIRLEGESLEAQYNDGSDRVVIDPAYRLGTPYDLRIEAADGRVAVFYNGEQAADLPLTGSGWYFKVGAYVQSNPDKGDQPDAAGEVVVYDLEIDHGGQAQE